MMTIYDPPPPPTTPESDDIPGADPAPGRGPLGRLVASRLAARRARGLLDSPEIARARLHILASLDQIEADIAAGKWVF